MSTKETEQPPQSIPAAPRRDYAPPALVRLGSLVELTAGSQGSNADMGLQTPTKRAS